VENHEHNLISIESGLRALGQGIIDSIDPYVLNKKKGRGFLKQEFGKDGMVIP